MYPGSCTNEYGVSITATVSTSTCEAWEAEDPFVEPGLREAILAASVAAVSTTAREAVDVLLGYVDEYGSEEGNTVMITDQDEAWIVEIYGGHQYCAMKMPDDKGGRVRQPQHDRAGGPQGHSRGRLHLL